MMVSTLTGLGLCLALWSLWGLRGQLRRDLSGFWGGGLWWNSAHTYKSGTVSIQTAHRKVQMQVRAVLHGLIQSPRAPEDVSTASFCGVSRSASSLSESSAFWSDEESIFWSITNMATHDAIFVRCKQMFTANKWNASEILIYFSQFWCSQLTGLISKVEFVD